MASDIPPECECVHEVLQSAFMIVVGLKGAINASLFSIGGQITAMLQRYRTYIYLDILKMKFSNSVKANNLSKTIPR